MASGRHNHTGVASRDIVAWMIIMTPPEPSHALSLFYSPPLTFWPTSTGPETLLNKVEHVFFNRNIPAGPAMIQVVSSHLSTADAWVPLQDIPSCGVIRSSAGGSFSSTALFRHLSMYIHVLYFGHDPIEKVSWMLFKRDGARNSG